MRLYSTAAAAALAAAVFVAAPASAIPYASGSMALSAFTSTTSSVTSTTLFTLTGSVIAGSPTGDLATVILPSPLSSPATLDFVSLSGFNFSDAGLGSFVATSAMLTNSGGGLNAFAKWNVIGNFTAGTDWDNSGSVLSANETWSLTQTGGAGNSISLAGTFNSPAITVTTPEPATLAVFGVGLAVLGMRRKRKSA